MDGKRDHGVHIHNGSGTNVYFFPFYFLEERVTSR